MLNNQPIESLSVAHVDYLERASVAMVAESVKTMGGSAGLFRFSKIKGIGRADKLRTPNRPEEDRLPSDDFLVAAYGASAPLAFLVSADPSSVSVHVGTWLATVQENDSSLLDRRHATLNTALRTLWTDLAIETSQTAVLPYSRAGLVLGIPSFTPSERADGYSPLDRLIRSLLGTKWAVLVLATPVGLDQAVDLKHTVLNEMRWVAAAAQAERTPSPLAEQYLGLLKIELAHLTAAHSLGAWRTAVYLLGDDESYPRLASLWRGLFSGKDSLPEPIRVWSDSDVGLDIGTLATELSMPDVPGHSGPGHYQHPFEYQTLLTSSQLATYVQLPNSETSGFSVKFVPTFDVVPQDAAKGEPQFLVGSIIQGHEQTPNDYMIPVKTLTRHAFVAGVTGTGKTNTVFYLLKQAADMKVPFLVLEPAKTEYRALFKQGALANSLRVFTLSNESVAPLRFNPFEVLPGTSVGVHLDLLRSVFNISFGMWTPLPQVLEQCMHSIYEDRGWNVTTDSNYRLDSQSNRAEAFPTLSDLIAKIDEVVPQLGYEQRVTADIRAALRTRVDSLRRGGKGAMFDVARSISMEELLQCPTILELEGMGDDDDKCFLMALLFIRLVEYRRNEGEAGELKHLLVIEEAHRLLANVASRGSYAEQADPRGKAVETFSNLLSEIRAYGEGIVVVDQIPNKLAPEVIKNTNAKIAHRIVAADDRAVLAGAMAMTELQEHGLATLTVGQAAVFSDGDDAPLLVKVPRMKGEPGQEPPDDMEIRRRLKTSQPLRSEQHRGLPLGEGCGADSSLALMSEAARDLCETIAFQRMFGRVVLSTLEDAGALDRLWKDVVTIVEYNRPAHLDQRALLHLACRHGAEWLAEKRGAQAGWAYSETRAFAEKLAQLLSTKIDGASTEIYWREFKQHAIDVTTRHFVPCPICPAIHENDSPICLYRYAASELVRSGAFQPSWFAADRNDALSSEGRRVETWEVCQDAGYELIEFPGPEWPQELTEQLKKRAQRACLCFGQQMLAQDERKSPRTVRKILEKLFREASG